MEEKDKAAEKLHMQAVTGQLRVKRKNAIGLDDSDDEDDAEDEDARRARSKMWKRPKVNDSIAGLGQSFGDRCGGTN